MPISPAFQNEVNFLLKLNPYKESITLSPTNQPILTGKRSCLRNFLSWFIHIITFTLVPRNAALDKVTREILNNAKELNQPSVSVTGEEKAQINISLKKLLKIVQDNGGSKSAKINKLLNVINKIKCLPLVQGIQAKEDFLPPLKEILRDDDILDLYDILNHTADFDALLPKLNEETQIDLLKKIFEIDDDKHEKLFENFLRAAISLPISIWDKAEVLKKPHIYNNLYHESKKFQFKIFFSLLDQCKNEDHKWNLFSLSATSEDMRFRFAYDVFYVCNFSKEQRFRLGLESFESAIELHLAIKKRSLDLPETKNTMLKLLAEMNEENKIRGNRLPFYSSSPLLMLFEPYLMSKSKEKFQENLDHLLYLITWLEKNTQEPHFLEECIRTMLDPINSEKEFIDLLPVFFKTFSYETFKNQFFTCVYNKYNFNLLINSFIEIIKYLKLNDAKDLISKNWSFIQRAYLDRPARIKYNKLIKYLDDDKSLNKLFYQPLVKEEINPIFDHFEKYPWKLMLALDSRSFGKKYLNKDLISEEKYPICRKILTKYQNLVENKEIENINNLLQNFFRAVRENRFHDALIFWRDISYLDGIADYFIQMVRQSSAEVICEESPYLNEAQLFVALLDKEANAKLCAAIAEGLKENLIGEETLKPIVQLTVEMQKFYLENFYILEQKEKSNLLEAFLNQPIPIKNNEFILSKCFNDPAFSDMTLQIGHETMRVHRAFLSLDPELAKLIPKEAKEIVVINEKREELKKAVEKLYHFRLIDLIKPRSLEALYNKKEAYPDYVLVCENENIYVHRAVLAAGFPFFQGLLGVGMKEAQDGRLVISPDDFDAVKAVVEYIYTNELPAFEDEDSEKYFYQTLGYYKAAK